MNAWPKVGSRFCSSSVFYLFHDQNNNIKSVGCNQKNTFYIILAEILIKYTKYLYLHSWLLLLTTIAGT